MAKERHGESDPCPRLTLTICSPKPLPGGLIGTTNLVCLAFWHGVNSVGGMVKSLGREVAFVHVDSAPTGAGTGPGQGTIAGNINPAGTIALWFVDPGNVSHGYLRTKNGAITTFDVPGAGRGSSQGTFPFCNNAADTITGWYIDSNGLQHGYLRRAH